MLKKIIHIFAIIFLNACSSKPYVVIPIPAEEGSKQNSVFIVNHGWHTGIIIAAKDLFNLLPELEKRFAKNSFLEIGWGDNGFYQAKEITTGLTLRAIFFPTESVIHAVAIPDNPYYAFPDSEIELIQLNNSNYSSLIQFIANSFLKSDTGETIKLKQGLYADSQFYRGEGDYYLFNTCNKWTAKGLKSAGFDINILFKLTADSIINYLKDEAELLTQTNNLMIEVTK